ncbi:MAG TPA: Yip1 family protein [Polyangia bacterium]|jgi:hypothetical protein
MSESDEHGRDQPETPAAAPGGPDAGAPPGPAPEPAAAGSPPGAAPPPAYTQAPTPYPAAPAAGPVYAGPAPPPSPYGVPESPYAAPAVCALHPQTPAVGLCPRCGGYLCYWCQRLGPDGVVLCATCAERVDVGGPVPWDQRDELGVWRAWWRTLKESLTGPDRFFARACRSVHTNTPLLYATMAVWLGQAWLMLLYSIVGIVMMVASKEVGGGIAMAVGSIVGFTLLAPVSALMQCYVSGGLTHLCARMLGGRGSYQASARAIAFSLGPYAFGVIPYLGGFAGMVTSIVLQVFGMKHAHGFSGGKAAAAVLLPLGVFTVLCCGGYVAVIAAMVAGHGRP